MRHAAAVALSGSASEPSVLEALVKRLGDNSLDVREAAANALAARVTDPRVTP